MTILIGLGHKARHGKDTVADHLVDHHGFQKFAFADHLKEAAKIIFGWTDEHVYGDLKSVVDEYWGFTPRWALQKMGTEAMRDVIDQNIWVKSLMRKIEGIEKVVITDVRFFTETKAVADRGGYLCRVRRQGIPSMNHQSEIELDSFHDWDGFIENDGSLRELFKKTDMMLESAYERSYQKTQVIE